MKTIGLLGGMSWESTALYYRLINEETKRRQGGLHSAPIAMVSVDFQPIEALQHRGEWDAMAEILAEKGRRIEAAGADMLLICTNTMHKVAPEVQAAIDIPLLHLADATAAAIVADGRSKIGLLGTRFTMEQEFYKGRLAEHGLEVLVPEPEDIEIVHKVIYEELCMGNVVDASRAEYLRIINNLHATGTEGVIAGCTEIGMLVKPEHTDVPIYDTTIIHAMHAVTEALK